MQPVQNTHLQIPYPVCKAAAIRSLYSCPLDALTGIPPKPMDHAAHRYSFYTAIRKGSFIVIRNSRPVYPPTPFNTYFFVGFINIYLCLKRGDLQALKKKER